MNKEITVQLKTTNWLACRAASGICLTALITALLVGAPCVAAAPTSSPVSTASAASPPPSPSSGAAPAPAAVPDAQQTLVQLQNQLRVTSDDKGLAVIGAQAAQIQEQAQRLVAARTADLASIEQVLRRPLPRGRTAAAEAQRTLIAQDVARRDQLQAALRQAQALETAASATFTNVAERRREGFSARVLEQSASPLEPQFWTGLSSAVGQDLGRLNTLAIEAAAKAQSAPEPRGLLSLALGLLTALVLVIPVRKGLERLVHRGLLGGTTQSRFGHTTHAVMMTLIDGGLPILGAAALRLSASWGNLLSEDANALAEAGVVAVGWAGAVLALGRALATDPDPRRRLLTVPDAVARAAGGLLSVVALITAAGFLLSRLIFVVGASVSASIATNCVLSLAYAAVAGAILVTAGGYREREPDGSQASAGSPAWTLISLTLGLAVVATCAAVLTGFTTLAVLISGQIFWLSVVAALTFLLLRFIDDLCSALFAPEGWAGRVFTGLFRLRPSTVAQAGILISAGLQLIVIVAAVSLALTPFGDSGRLLTAHLGQLGRVIHIGSATISPSAIASGLVVLAVGLGLAHLVRGWVVQRYLPATDWDAGIRNSVSTGVSYIGVGAALLCALAAMGLGFRQIALIASALSVGIGFGLQQVVQNFVSGLILLIERPVKVGDWVNVGGVEGDIRRIRVRATEIQTFDRTTVIVPNSDLITKQVQNKTLGDPRGRIQLDVSIANPGDAARAADLILSVADGLSKILREPKPAVYIDSLAGGGGVNFKIYMFVPTPRDATKARSDVYSAVLTRFQEAGIAFMGVAGPQLVVIEPGPKLQKSLDAMGSPEAPNTLAGDDPRAPSAPSP
jgi:potassium efflux system protein